MFCGRDNIPFPVTPLGFHAGRLAVVILVEFACCQLSALTPCSAGTTDDDFAPIRDGIIAAQHENRERLPSCFTVVWHRQSYENGFKNRMAEQRGGIKTSGDYHLWRSGRKVATKYVQDHIMGSRKRGGGDAIPDGDYHDHDASIKADSIALEAVNRDSGNPRIERFGQKTAANGEDFRVVPNVQDPTRLGIKNQPEYRLHENWLHIVGWNEPSFLEVMRDDPSTELILEDWEVVDDADRHLCEITYRNVQTGLSMSLAYNLDRGCELERRTLQLKNGALGSEEVRTLATVSDGCWFPVAMTTRAFDPKGNDTLRHEYTVDLAASRFGDCEAIPSEVFTIDVTPKMRVSDYRAGRKVVYTGESAPLPIVELTARANRFMGRPLPWIIAALYTHWGVALATFGILLLAIGFLRRRHNAQVKAGQR